MVGGLHGAGHQLLRMSDALYLNSGRGSVKHDKGGGRHHRPNISPARAAAGGESHQRCGDQTEHAGLRHDGENQVRAEVPYTALDSRWIDERASKSVGRPQRSNTWGQHEVGSLTRKQHRVGAVCVERPDLIGTRRERDRRESDRPERTVER